MTVNFIQDPIHRAVHEFVTWASTRPNVYYPLRKLTGRFDERCVTHDTTIVIEGAPRSSNSTTVSGFIARQKPGVHVAHHLHHAAQLLRAVELGLPAVMLIRRPRDAILSNIALGQENLARHGQDARGRVNALSFLDISSGWLTFYTALVPVVDKLVIDPFPQVTADIAPMIREVNRRFGTDFETKAPATEDQPKLGYHARRNPLRAELLEQLSFTFDEALARSPRLADTLEKAEHIYDMYMDLHQQRQSAQ